MPRRKHTVLPIACCVLLHLFWNSVVGILQSKCTAIIHAVIPAKAGIQNPLYDLSALCGK